MARRIRREPSAPDQQAPALDLRSADRARGDGTLVVSAGAGGILGTLAMAQLGHTRRGCRDRLLPRAVTRTRARHPGRVRRAARDHAIARAAALAAVADLDRDLRYRLDRPVRWPCGGRQTALLLQGPAVPAHRTAMAARGRLSALQPALLSRRSPQRPDRQPR